MMRMTTGLVFVCAAFIGACAWGEGSPDENKGGGVDAAPSSSAVCGDGVCAASEVSTCSNDCGSGGGGSVTPTCGNQVCETGETNASCPNDCTSGGGGSGSGSGSGSNTACPSDQFSCIGCLIDASLCPAGHTQASCQACTLGGGGGLPGGGGTCNNDGTCDAAEMTDFTCADCF